MPGKRKRLSNASPMPAYYTNTGGYNLPPVEIRGRAPQWAREQNYYDQLANFYADRFDVNGNNSRLPEIIGRAKANPEFWNEDGSLNQKGNAYITQQKHFGVGSNYYNRMNEYAKQTAYGLAQVAGAPYLAGLTGRQLLGSTIGGTIGSIEGSEIGRRFDNPATSNYAGSELGALLGGLAGGAIGGNVKPLFRKYIKGMTKLDQAQTRHWDRKELNQLLKNPQITSEQINKNLPLNTSPRILDYYGIKSNSNPRTSFRFLERPSKLTYAEKAGIPKGQSRLENNPEVFKNAKAFAKKYKYDVPVTIEGIKNMYRRHNRFFRTVDLNEYPEGDIFFDNITNKNIYPELKGLTNKEATMLLASKGYPLYYRTGYKGDLGKGFADDFVFVSPNLAENKGYQINGLDKTVMLQRPFSFGSPNKWHLNADYDVSNVINGVYNKGVVGFGNAAPTHEVKIATDKLIPVKIAEEGDLGSNIGVKYKTNNSINDLSDDWTNWNDYETGNLSDVIFHRKYGGRSKFPFGGHSIPITSNKLNNINSKTNISYNYIPEVNDNTKIAKPVINRKVKQYKNFKPDYYFYNPNFASSQNFPNIDNQEGYITPNWIITGPDNKAYYNANNIKNRLSKKITKREVDDIIAQERELREKSQSYNNIRLNELNKINFKARNKKRYGGSLRRRLESGGYLSY